MDLAAKSLVVTHALKTSDTVEILLSDEEATKPQLAG